MNIEFSISMKAFSINKMSYRDARYKTKEFQDWFSEFVLRLNEVKELQDVADTYKAHGGAFLIWIEVVYPPHVYYNKSKQISSKTFDVTNTEKIIVDAIFREVLGVDDKNLVKCVSTKRAGATHSIDIKLEVDTNYYA